MRSLEALVAAMLNGIPDDKYGLVLRQLRRYPDAIDLWGPLVPPGGNGMRFLRDVAVSDQTGGRKVVPAGSTGLLMHRLTKRCWLLYIKQPLPQGVEQKDQRRTPSPHRTAGIVSSTNKRIAP